MFSSVVDVLIAVVTVVEGGVGVAVVVSREGGRDILDVGDPTPITVFIAGNIMSLVTEGNIFVSLEYFAFIVFSAFVRNKRNPCLNTFCPWMVCWRGVSCVPRFARLKRNGCASNRIVDVTIYCLICIFDS